ncbi:SDR family NAD(P)-dependent oxidoreductase [Flaviflexus huanghaiensis]|uniref:SDR family NAD(P)-dependent oxidoreductase n=1 Tax=Flaviflexus huanghaiensis TaxID=1111473 RepID=UPI0015F97150|nr:SDR family oxidoreductase [Flaviflexus huanghaiensis]
MKILVTGASRGIGRAIAHAIARPGREIHVHARSIEALAETEELCRATGADIVRHAADLSQPSEALRLASELPDLDMLVNNAGVSGTERLPWDITPEEFDATLKTNVLAPFILSSAAARSMLDRGGFIVDLSSGAAVTDRADSADYWVSKTALMRLGGSFHEAGHDRGLKVFEVAPGVVQTDMTLSMRMHDGRSEWTDPSEVAGIIAAIADGELDGLAGTHIRAGVDTLDELRARAARGVGSGERRLRLTPWGA